MKLNENAKAWIAALRSGRYKQGKGYLTKKSRGKTRHCCLGVACILFKKAGGSLKIDTRRDTNFVTTLYAGHDRDLPPQVQDWLGLRSSTGFFNDVMESLAGRNDSGTPFKKIAALIVEHKDAMFRKKRA